MTGIRELEAELAGLERERLRGEQRGALWAMTPEQRRSAMWRRELSYFQLLEWSRRCPDEVPRLPTDLTAAGEPGEFAWIVMSTPEWVEQSGPERDQ